MMKTAVLASGSNGNSVFIETNRSRVLIDAGVSGRQVELRLNKIRKDARDLDAVFLTHDHHDHVSGARVVANRFNVPVFLNQATLDAAGRSLRGVQQTEVIRSGEEFTFGGIRIRTIPVSHDSADAICYILSEGGTSIGVFTDLGIANQAVIDAVPGLDGIILETNHDVEKLRNGRYPRELQRRIRGDRGHLSNHQAAEIIRNHASSRLKVIYCAHLSAENNHPDLVLEAMNRALNTRDDLGHVRVLLTSRRTVSLVSRLSATD